jgi:hypothetical protein
MPAAGARFLSRSLIGVSSVFKDSCIDVEDVRTLVIAPKPAPTAPKPDEIVVASMRLSVLASWLGMIR